MELNFFYAKHEQRMWLIRMKLFLLSFETAKADITNTESHLEKWLMQTALKKFQHLTEIQEIATLFQDIQNTVRKIIRLKNNDEEDEAEKEYETLEIQIERILVWIDKLELKYKTTENEEFQNA